MGKPIYEAREKPPSVLSRTMLNRKRAAVLVVAGLLLGVPSLWAHHGLAAFDTKHTVRMQGTVTKFEWINPHAYIYADLTDENGKVANWKLEMGSLGMLTRFGGWTPDTVKPGDKVTVQGFRAKDGSPYMSLGRLSFRTVRRCWGLHRNARHAGNLQVAGADLGGLERAGITVAVSGDRNRAPARDGRAHRDDHCF
jgi:hypothetical protein